MSERGRERKKEKKRIGERDREENDQVGGTGGQRKETGSLLVSGKPIPLKGN